MFSFLNVGINSQNFCHQMRFEAQISLKYTRNTSSAGDLHAPGTAGGAYSAIPEPPSCDALILREGGRSRVGE